MVTARSGVPDVPSAARVGSNVAGPVVAEPPVAGPTMPGPGDADPNGPVAVAGLLARLEAVAGQVADVGFDGLDDLGLEGFLDGLRGPIARLEATRASGLATLERRAARRAPAGGATAAELEQRRRNARRHRLTPSAAKRAAEAGRAASDHVATGAAFRAGALDTEHARLIGELLRRVPLGSRDDLEQQLVDLARQLDPVAFGRKARELVARQAPEAAARTEQIAVNRRSFRAADTPDGGFSFAGLLYGTAAETARTAVQAFRRPDTPDEHRTPEQAGADAFEQLCEAALRSEAAPTDHGVRPHVIVVIDEADLARPDGAGVARLGHSAQPVTASAIGHLLDDCTLSRLVRDAAGTPIEASAEVRTVPAGLWRALLARDGGCTWDGCDAPASWCDVAHGQHAFRHDGRLSPDNAALLCRRHHRRFDNGPYRITITGDQVRYQRVAPTPSAALEPIASEVAVAATTSLPSQHDVRPLSTGETARPAPTTQIERSPGSTVRPRPGSGRGPSSRAPTDRRRRPPVLRRDEHAQPVPLFDSDTHSAGPDPP
jgi:hypothetical protein